jgi:hypothetical protein
MKSFALGLALALGVFAIGCSSEDESAPPAPEAPVAHMASSLERKLTALIPVPSDTPIGQSIDALIDAQTASLVALDPIVELGANGKRCTISKFNDDSGAEQMRREKCDKGGDVLTAGKLVYTDANSDGKIDQFSDTSAASYDLYDDDLDGKLDRMVESAAHIGKPVSLSDFAESVTIIKGGKIATRERSDKNHDGKFDTESVTATTAFEVVTK